MTDEIDLTSLDLPVLHLPPKFQGLKACHVSDFHVDSEADLVRLEQAIRLINEENPDLVFLTGDYFSGPESMSCYIAEVRRTLAQLRPCLGIFAIAGNHDHLAFFWAISEALRSAGAYVLANENHLLELGGSQVFIVGVDDLWAQRGLPIARISRHSAGRLHDIARP